jgi:hypothetical protein
MPVYLYQDGTVAEMGTGDIKILFMNPAMLLQKANFFDKKFLLSCPPSCLTKKDKSL